MLTLEHAWDLEARLKQDGLAVVTTRRTDQAVNTASADVNGDGKAARDGAVEGTLDELQARINVCNAADADLLVSLHANGFSTPKPRGYETWFTKERSFGDRSERFATLVYRELRAQLAGIGYALSPDEERGVKPDTLAQVQTQHGVFEHFVVTGPAIKDDAGRTILVPSAMPGAIVEALFVSNGGDATVLASPEGRAAIVTAYERAILAYFAEYPG